MNIRQWWRRFRVRFFPRNAIERERLELGELAERLRQAELRWWQEMVPQLQSELADLSREIARRDVVIRRMRRAIGKFVEHRPVHGWDDHSCPLCRVLEETREW